jgi:20S proteasome alpha/beta subunit
MTIANGYSCSDGIVLLADSLESNGATKRMVSKIWSYQVAEEWGIAIASAGDADLADSFNENLGEILGNSGYDEVRLLAKLRTAIAQVRNDYPYDDFGMLIGIFSNTVPPTHKLYRVYGKHLGPVSSYQAIGSGSQLADFLSSQIHTPLLSVDESIRLGILTLARVKEHVDGCDGPTRVISYKRGDTDWRITSSLEAAQIESEFPAHDFRKNLQDYWVFKNPNSSWPGGYRWLAPPGVKWKKSAKLNTQE